MSSLSAPDVCIALFIGSVIFAVLLMLTVLSAVTAAERQGSDPDECLRRRARR